MNFSTANFKSGKSRHTHLHTQQTVDDNVHSIIHTHWTIYTCIYTCMYYTVYVVHVCIQHAMCTAVQYTELNWALFETVKRLSASCSSAQWSCLKRQYLRKVYISMILKTIQWVAVECPHLTQHSLETCQEYSNITCYIHLHMYLLYTWALSHEVKKSGQIAVYFSMSTPEYSLYKHNVCQYTWQGMVCYVGK